MKLLCFNKSVSKCVSLIFNILFLSFFSINLYAYVLSGTIFEDANLNYRFDTGEKGIPNVGVSNGKTIVLTDKNGRYSIELNSEDIVFVIKPAEYNFFVDKNTNKPLFYHIIKENEGFGSNIGDKNFPLVKSQSTDNFSTIILGDIQVRNDEEINFTRDALLPALNSSEATLVLTLGDNAFDNLDVYPRLTGILGQARKTMYYLPGNHDTNDKLEGPLSHYEIYNQFFGPDYYAFNYGKVHFVVLNDVKWESGKYHGELGHKQLTWLGEDLKYVNKDNLIVLAMHIPLISWSDRNNPQHHVNDRDELFKLLSGFDRVLSLAGHTHTLEKLYPDDKINGWENGLAFPQIIAGAVCGSWWGGEKGESGVPFSYMKDGTPKGYFTFNFSGNKYEEKYISLDKSKDFQMDITLTDDSGKGIDNIIEKSETRNVKVAANVFNGDMLSDVVISFDGDAYSKMDRTPLIDPFLNERLSGGTIPVESTHIWLSSLPASLDTGAHTIRVKFVDKYGNKYVNSKVFEIK